MGIFLSNFEVKSRIIRMNFCIIRMNFCIIKPKFGQKWTYSEDSHVIYRWRGIMRLISVVGIFVDSVESEPCIIRMNLCIISG